MGALKSTLRMSYNDANNVTDVTDVEIHTECEIEAISEYDGVQLRTPSSQVS